MNDLITPESRVFHIARECYIIYLGDDQSDYHPFLRIGNTPNMADEIHEAVSTIVITDNHVGNPLREILNVPKKQGRYLGDIGVVDTMKRFFASFKLPTESVSDYKMIKQGEGRHVVWFYSSGNVSLHYNNKTIFDLSKREKEDRHFVRLLADARVKFYRNPFRYIKQDLTGTGIILTGGNAFWFEEGELLSVSAHSGLVPRLMCHGIDPDFISAMAIDLTMENIDSPDSSVYVGMLKRSRQCQKTLRVITAEPELQRKIKLLFPQRGDIPATVEVSDISGGKKTMFSESSVMQSGKGWIIRRDGLPTVSFNNEISEGLSIDLTKGTIRCRGKGQNVVFDIPDGYPVILTAQSDSNTAEKYTTYLFNNIKDSLHPSEIEVISILDDFFRKFQNEAVSGKSSAGEPLQQAALKFSDFIENNSLVDIGLSWFYFSNIHTILSKQHDSLSADNKLAQLSRNALNKIKTVIKRFPTPDGIYPFIGDLYIGDNTVLLWRVVKRNFTSADFETTQAINESIIQLTNQDTAVFRADYDRLLQLIRKLRIGRSGPLSKDQLALFPSSSRQSALSSEKDKKNPATETPSSGIRERYRISVISPKSSDPPKSSSVGKPSAAKKSATSTAAPKTFSSREIRTEEPEKPESITVKKKPKKMKRSYKPRLLSALILILLASPVLWDISGYAPWGQFIKRSFRNNQDIGLAVNGSQAGTEAAADATEEYYSQAESAVGESSDERLTAENDQTVSDNGNLLDSRVNGREREPPFNSDEKSMEDSAEASDVQNVMSSGQLISGNPEIALNDSADSAVANNRNTDNQTSANSASSQQALQNSSNNTVVNADTVPISAEEMRAYLTVEDRILITEVDIHLTANEIAVLNGFKDLDYRVYTGADPDWIFPGNNLKLPDSNNYTIRRGDTIWYLAVREIRFNVEKNLKDYDQAVAILNDLNSSEDKKKEATSTLENIIRSSRSSSLRNIVEEVLRSGNM